MKKRKLMRKVFAAALAVAMVGGTAVATPVGSMIGANITASAASSSPVVTVGDYQYILYSDSTAKVVGYTGTKNLSTTSVGMPSVIYSGDIDTTWSYNEYISSYNVTQMQASIFSGCKFKPCHCQANYRLLQEALPALRSAASSSTAATPISAVLTAEVHMLFTTRAIPRFMRIRQIRHCMSAASALQPKASPLLLQGLKIRLLQAASSIQLLFRLQLHMQATDCSQAPVSPLLHLRATLPPSVSCQAPQYRITAPLNELQAFIR